MRRIFGTASFLVLCGWLAITPVFAHHSYAMFDRSKVASVKGTIAKTDWNNPHVWFWLYVADEQHQYQLYGFESGAISSLARFGWTRETVKAGDKIQLDYFPLRSGEHGGFMVRVIHADGSVSPGDIASQIQLPGEKGPPPSVEKPSGATP